MVYCRCHIPHHGSDNMCRVCRQPTLQLAMDLSRARRATATTDLNEEEECQDGS